MLRMALLLWVCLSLTSIPAQGQEWGFDAGAGLASSRMDDLKYMHAHILSQYPIPGKMLSSFPPYGTFGLGVRKELYPSLSVRVGYQNTNSGSRSNYTDYSGRISTNMTTTSHRLGASVFYGLFETDWMSLSAFGQADLNYTLAKISSSIVVMGYSDASYYEYRSLSPAIAAGAEQLFHLEMMSLGVEVAYQVDIRGELTEKESGNYMTDPLDRDRVLSSDWTGWRAMVRMLFWL